MMSGKSGSWQSTTSPVLNTFVASHRMAGTPLADWRSTLSRDVASVRDAFRKLFTRPIRFEPFIEDGRRGVRFEGRIGLEAVLGDLVTRMASPEGFDMSGIPFARDFSRGTTAA